MREIDIESSRLYEYDKPEFNQRTTDRLTQISKMGMTEIGDAQFGIKGIISGLYLEKVWAYNEQEWTEYVEWAQSVIDKHNQ